ncbi:MAG: choice-of-anchor I family protein [Solirubrobacteraceae bacterium]
MRPASCLTLAATVLAATAAPAFAAPAEVELTPLGRTPAGGEAAAEIAAFHAPTKQAFVTDAAANTIDVFDLTDPANPVAQPSIDLAPYGGAPNSVATSKACGGLVAVAQEAPTRTDAGKVLFFKPDGTFLRAVTAGALPDMLTFTPNGRTLLVANEGEPAADGSVDPEGSVTIIDQLKGCSTAPRVRTAGFTGSFLKSGPIRVFGPDTTFAKNVEPEYIDTDTTGSVAYVSLQEANAIALVSVATAKVLSVRGLGYKNHGRVPFDPSDRDGGANLRTFSNVFGMYQPDAIAVYSVLGLPFVVTANEGDARDYGYFAEESRVSGLTLDPTAFPDPAVKGNTQLGRLTVTKTLGDTDNDGDYDELYAFGGRSMSILDPLGGMVWDSGAELEQYIAANDPTTFNADHAPLVPEIDNRSDNKGPEPEGIAIGNVAGRPYAFLGNERQGGIVAYDLRSKVGRAELAGYVNTRPADRGPEGLSFVAADDSPNGRPLVLVTNEITGTVNILQVTPK